MELYTSLVRLKQSMNGGELPPMTDVPVSIQDVIDPHLTIGLGALTEDAERGLRCPVRGCGVWLKTLTRHVNAVHYDIGGARGLKTLLEIPTGAKLCTTKYSEQKRVEVEARRPEALAVLARARAARPNVLRDPAVRDAANNSLRTVYKLAGLRNLANRCEAQMRHALIDLQNRLGRSPSILEARAMIGEGFVSNVISVYGTWNAAKAQFGLDQHRRGYSKKEITREAVLEALGAYHDKHGCLPNVNQAQRPTRTPMIPSRPTICKSMGTESWPEAMRRVASLLDIRGGRYGLPEKLEGAA